MADYLMKYGILDLIDKYMDDCVAQNKNSLIEVIPKGTSDYNAMQLFLERCSTGYEPKMAILDKERAVIKEYSRYNKIEEKSRRKIQHDKIVINNVQKNNIRSDGSINKFNYQRLSDIEKYGTVKKESTTNSTNVTMNRIRENQEKIKAQKEKQEHLYVTSDRVQPNKKVLTKKENAQNDNYQLEEYLLLFENFKKQINDYLQNRQVVDVNFLMKNTDLNRLFEIIPSMKLKLEFGIWLRLHFGWTLNYFLRDFSKKIYGISHETVRRRLIKYNVPYRKIDFKDEENIRKIVFDVENFIN